MLSHALRAKGQGSAPPATNDPNFKQVSLLLHGDGTNGAQNNTFIGANNPAQYYGSFNGSTQYLTTPNSTALDFGTGDFTVEFWVYMNSTSDTTFVGKWTASNYAWIIQYISGTGLRLYYGNNGSLGSFIVSGWTPSTSTWYHVAVTRSGGSVRMFINGTQIGTTTTQTSSYSSTSTSAIGVNLDGGIIQYLNGRLSNLRVVKGTALYTANFTPPNGTLPAVTGTQLLTLQNATIVDNSTNNFTITNVGSVAMTDQYPVVTRNGNTTQGTNTPFSQAAGAWSNYFNGTGDYLVTGSSITLSGDFTVEAWAYASNLIANRAVVQIGDDLNSNGPLFYISTAGKLNCYAGSAVFTGTATISANSWVHIAVVRSGTTAKSYVNGVLDSTVSFTANPTGTVKVGAEWYNGTIGGTQMLGYISNVRITTTAVYTANFTPSTTPLTAISGTSLLTCQSNYFKDNSSNNFTLTATGIPSVQPFSPFAPTAAYSTSVNGGSMYFGTTTSYLSLAANSACDLAGGSFTLEAWIYPTANNSTYLNWVVGNRRTTTPLTFSYGFGTYNNALRYVDSTGSVFNSSTPISLFAWHHIAATYDGTSLRMYQNGVLVYTSTSISLINNSGNVTVGSYSGDNPYFSGYISDVRILKGTALYTGSTYTVPTAPLTAITNTSLLLSGTNAGIVDNAIKNDLETVGNAQVSTSVKKYGTGSMYFDGTDDWLTSPDTPNLQLGTGNFTIEGWVYLNAVGAARGFVSKGTSTTGWSLGTNSLNQVVFSYASSSIASTGVLLISTWYFVTVVREGTGSNQTKIYINGTNDGTGTISTDFNQTNILYVGANRVGGDALNGYIDDFRVTKGIARYTANFTPPTQAFPNQ